MTALLHIGTGENGIVDHLRQSGVEVVAAASGPVDVVVIDVDVESPLQVARRVHGEAPDAHILFLTTPATDAALRRELMIGRIGTHWSIAPADDPAAVEEAVRQAITATERRRKLRTTLGRVNLQLAQTPGAARRTVISDHFLALVLEQLADAVVVLDPAGKVLAWNGAAARAFGEIRRGAPFGETLPAAARDAIQAACDAPEGRAESALTAHNGVEYGVRATALRGPDKRVIGIAVVARDITAARKEERQRKLVADAVRVLASTLEVREALQRLAELVVTELADLATVDVIEGEEVKRYAVAARSPRHRELLEQFRGASMTGNRNHPSQTVIARGEPVVRNDLTDAMLAQMAVSEEHLAILRELGPHAVIVSPLRAGDETIGALLVSRTSPPPFSQSEVATVQEIARQATNALHTIWSYHAAAEAGRLKDEFLATLSHELRTPMTSILGWAQILRLDDALPEVLRDGLESIERSARAQAQLIDDLLDLSRMQMGKVQFQTRPFSLPAVVRAAVETVRPAGQARGVTLAVDAPEELVVNGDPDRMQQVIWNLLSNAVKFSNAGTEVRVSVTSDGSCAHVTVTDQGRGIAPEFLPHVFDRFRQADAATTRRYGGLGLGLAIVKQLVELHGGMVRASSPGLGRGATFDVLLPLPSNVPAVPPADDSRSAPLPDLSRVCLLLVDDDPSSAGTLCTILERAGAEVRTAQNVSAALESLRDRIPHVLISGVAEPDEDGLALIRAVRGRLRVPPERLPAIALTASHDVDLRVALLGAGFQRFMTRPVDAQALAQAVARLVRQAQR